MGLNQCNSHNNIMDMQTQRWSLPFKVGPTPTPIWKNEWWHLTPSTCLMKTWWSYHIYLQLPNLYLHFPPTLIYKPHNNFFNLVIKNNNNSITKLHVRNTNRIVIACKGPWQTMSHFVIINEPYEIFMIRDQSNEQRDNFWAYSV